MVLTMDDDEEGKQENMQPEDEEEAQFLNFSRPGQNEEEQKAEVFKDSDYREDNATLNRVKAFTFIKD